MSINSTQALARKWRPRNFSELVGQEHIVKALINALNQNRLHHAFLFAGTRGVGKTTIARILAKCLNCAQGVCANPCGECTSCQEIDQGRFVDLIEVDAASRTRVEDTRELLGNVLYAPTRGRYKIYLIDEVHMLSGHSFNALLKTLEEPPPHVKFLLATTDPQKLPITVLSRCLQFNLKALSETVIQQHLQTLLVKEKINAETEALALIAHAADGSVRDSLSLLDQAIAFGGGVISTADVCTMLGHIEKKHIANLLDALAAHDANRMMCISQQLAEAACDFDNALEALLSMLHQITLCQALADNYHNQQQQQSAHIKQLANLLKPEDVQLYYQIALIGRRDLPLASDPKSGFEMVLLRMLAFTPVIVGDTLPPTVAPLQEQQPDKQTSTVHEQKHITDTFKKSKDEWHHILTQLQLTDMTRALAEQCSIQSQQDNHIALLLDPKQAPLLNANQEQRLSAALTHYYGKATTCSIALADKTIDTPAKRQQRHFEEQKSKAVTQLANNANVQTLLKTFGAQLQSESVVPTTHANLVCKTEEETL